MKKILLLCLAAILMFSCVSCAEKEPVISSSENKPMSSAFVETSSVKAQSEAAALESLKQEVSQKAKEALAQVVTNNMTEIGKAKISYDWLFYHFKYRGMAVDVSGGYTDQLTLELADYYFKYHKGSCEHYAAVQKVLLEELGFECFYIRGERFSYWTKKWGDHTWLHVKYGEDMYHVDGLYGGLFYDVKETTFMVPDEALKKTHRWNKDTYTPCTKPQILK